jgi:hypothetical protein
MGLAHPSLASLLPVTICALIGLPLPTTYTSHELPSVDTVVVFTAQMVGVEDGVAVVENENHSSFY